MVIIKNMIKSNLTEEQMEMYNGLSAEEVKELIRKVKETKSKEEEHLYENDKV